MSGWPDKPGVPLNPERDGWHWVTYKSEETPRARFWYADDTGWGFGLPADDPHLCRYEGPILYPAEVAAREAAAFQRGAEAAVAYLSDRQAAYEKRAMNKIDGPPNLLTPSDAAALIAGVFESAAAAIRALSVPEDRNDRPD